MVLETIALPTELFSFMSFLIEIKYRFYLIFYVWFYTSIVCYYYKEYLYLFLINILILSTNIPIFYYFIITNITEIFKIYFKIIEFFNSQITFIYFIYHLFLFFIPAWYKNEFYIYKNIIFIIFFCWFLNTIFIVFILFPLTWAFFESFQFLLINQNFSFEVKINEFLFFFFKIYFFTQFYFLNFILFFFVFKDLHDKFFIKKFRKCYYLAFFLILVSLIQDLVSQSLFWLVFCLFYEFLLFINLFNKKLLNKAYSLMVERSAHNGLVVGSSPTKLINMLFYKLNKKLYKINNIEKNIKKPSFLLFINGLNKNYKNLYVKNQKTQNFKLYKINNKTITKNLKNNCLIKIVNSSIFLGLLNNQTLTKTMLINSFYFLFLHVLALKLNNKIYSILVLNKLYSLNYFQTKQLITQFCVFKLKLKNRNNMI